jgi:hypothetical protein
MSGVAAAVVEGPRDDSERCSAWAAVGSSNATWYEFDSLLLESSSMALVQPLPVLLRHLLKVAKGAMLLL